MAKVAVLKCESYGPAVYDTVSKALDAIHAAELFKKGMRVLIKPNVVSPSSPLKAVNTHPSVIDAICRYVSRFDAKIFIGDSSGVSARHGTYRAFEKSGLVRVAQKWDAELINFDKEPRVIINNDHSVLLKHMPVPKRLLQMDLIINACKLKTHIFTGYTGAVKNMFGVLPGRSKIHAHVISGDAKLLSDILLDIYLTIMPHLTVMDGIIGMEGNGPRKGKAKKTGLILASKDGIALDIVASRIIGFKPHELELLKSIRKRKLTPRGVKIIGLRNAKITYKKPLTYFGCYKRIAQFLIEKQRLHLAVDKRICEQCGKCIAACPQGAIKRGSNYPTFNPKKCIMCYSCHEVCPYKAIMLTKPWAARVINKFTRRFVD